MLSWTVSWIPFVIRALVTVRSEIAVLLKYTL